MTDRIPNEEQQTVINETEHNILLFASAGTGKTFTVAQRVNRLIESGLAKPDDILCLTFTTKASDEMRTDILQYTGDPGKEVFISTIHGFCYSVLRESTKKTNAVYSEPEVIDEVDADELLKDSLRECGFEDKDTEETKGFLYPICELLKNNREADGPYTGDEEKDYQAVFDRLDQSRSPGFISKFRFKPKSSSDWIMNVPLYEFLKTHAGAWMNAYCNHLRADNAFDFTDLICHVHRAMQNEGFRDEWQQRFKYIIVDEMQDTSELEYDILRCLFRGNRSMMCGDFFQTIYEWRGTNPKAILPRYDEEFRPLHIHLTHNYRSTRTLCNASFGYLKNAFPNQIGEYYPDTLTIESDEEGDKILHFLTLNRDEEARLITEYLRRTKPEDPSKVCILSRTNTNISELYRALIRQKEANPHDYRFFTVDEEKRFSNKAVIKDVLAFPRVMLSERTDEIAFARICKKLVKGVGEQTIKAIQQSGTAGLSLTSFIHMDTYTEDDPYASLIRAVGENSVVVYDTETTDLDLSRGQAIQIAAIRLDAKGNITDKMDTYVIPTVPISKGAFATHHISMETVLEKGIETKEALIRFSKFAEGAVLVGHNSIRFDHPLIQRQLKENGLPELNIRGHYDTMMIAKQFLPRSKNYKLETLCKHFGIINQGAHDAYWDIKATGEVLFRLIPDYVVPTQEKRKEIILKYKGKFAPVMQLFNELEYDHLGNADFNGLIEKAILLYEYENCEKESDRAALEELKEYIQTMPTDEGAGPMREFLSNMNLSGSQMDILIQKMKKVPIITVHNAKGCEFDTVIIADAVDGSFPFYTSVREGREPEERRLFYVALSRAKKKLIIITPGSLPNSRQAKVSPYISYIPTEYLDKRQLMPKVKQ